MPGLYDRDLLKFDGCFIKSFELFYINFVIKLTASQVIENSSKSVTSI